MDDIFSERVYGVPWVALAGLAGLIAVAYAVLPAAAGADGLRWLVLRWFHTIAWALFGLAALVRARIGNVPVEAAAVLAATGGLVYVALMLTTVSGEG
ncbi:MAG TPA: hypothetical protein VG742_22990 [Dongiaceae bacterium]|nr:hypothetical protein [Dongiaceae bacterium]